MKKNVPWWGEAESSGFMSIDCDKQDLIIIRAFTHNRSGEVLESERGTPDPISVSKAGTVGRLFAEYACNPWKIGLLPTVADRLKFQP